MDALDFMKAKKRMCGIENCLTCPMSLGETGRSCVWTMKEYPEDAVKIVEKWAKEHPEITRQSVFLQRYPNAFIEGDGVLGILPCELDTTFDSDLCYTLKADKSDCFECRRSYWLAPAEEG